MKRIYPNNNYAHSQNSSKDSMAMNRSINTTNESMAMEEVAFSNEASAFSETNASRKPTHYAVSHTKDPKRKSPASDGVVTAESLRISTKPPTVEAVDISISKQAINEDTPMDPFTPEGEAAKEDIKITNKTISHDELTSTYTAKTSDDSQESIPLEPLLALDISSTEKDIMNSKETISLEEVKATHIEKNEKKHPKDGLHGRGLLHYKKWWFRNRIEIKINGELITGIPLFIENNTLRVVNEKYSYFIPIEKIDYIRTTDGLDSGCRHPAAAETHSSTKSSKN